MSFSFHRLMSRLVLISFLFQTLWPSLVFARTEIPLGSAWSDDSCGLTFKAQSFRDSATDRDLLKIEAYITEAGEERGKEGPRGGGKEANPWGASPVSPVPSSPLPSTPLSGTTPPASFLPSPSVPSTPLSGGSTPASEGSRTRPAPSPLSLASSAPRPSAPAPSFPPSEAGSELSSAPPASSSRASTATSVKKLLERVVDARTFEDVESGLALYSDLSRTAEGVSWAFGGLAFVLDKQGNLLATGVANSDMPVILCTRGTVALDNATVGQVLARGQGVVVRGTGRIGRLDAWATGRGWSPGIVRITEGSSQHIGQLYVHQGQGENDGHLTIEQSLNHRGDFVNHASLQMEEGSVVRGGGVFWNQNHVGGESYTLQSHVIRNQNPQEPQRAARPKEAKETGEEAKEPKEPEEAERKKATLTATKSVTLTGQRLEQYGDVAAPSVELAVGEIEDGPASTVKAVRLRTTFKTSWDAQGIIEVDDWVDESARTVRIVNVGTLTTHTSAAFSGQFETGVGGTSTLTGLSLAPPLLVMPPPLPPPPQPAPQTLRQRIGQAQPAPQPAPQPVPQPWVNRGTTTLRHVRSLGDPRRAIVNEEGAELSFLEGGVYSKTRRDSRTGGLTMGDVTNRGTISFGRGDYYTGLLTNHGEYRALRGQRLWVSDLNNQGKIHFGNNFRVDMTRGTFTQLGQMVGTAGNLTIQFGTGVNIAQYLVNNGIQHWRLPGTLRVGGALFHNTVDWRLGVPFYMWVTAFLNDAEIHTHGFTLRAKTFGQGTLGGRLGAIKSGNRLDIGVDGDIDTQRGFLESAGEARVTSWKGNILVGQGVEPPRRIGLPRPRRGYREKNGAYILSHRRLILKGQNILVRFGDVGSKGSLALRFRDQLLLESAALKARGQTVFQGRSVLIKRVDPYRNTGVAICEWEHWHDQWQEEDGGDPSQLCLAGGLKLLVNEAIVIASDIGVSGNVTDKHGRILTPEAPGILRFQEMNYRNYAIARAGDMTRGGPCGKRRPTFTLSGNLDLSSFSRYELASLVVAGGSITMRGDRSRLGSHTQGSFEVVVPTHGSLSLLPMIAAMSGGIIRPTSPDQNPLVVYSAGSLHQNRIDPALLVLVTDSIRAPSFMANPSSDLRHLGQLRQLADPDTLVWVLQQSLVALLGQSYIFPGLDGRAQLARLLQNGRDEMRRRGRPFLTRAEAEEMAEPALIWEIGSLNEERVLVPILMIPQGFIRRHIKGPCRGAMIAGQGIAINMSTFVEVIGGSMETGRGYIDLETGGGMFLASAADRQGDGDNFTETQTGGQFSAPNGCLRAAAAGRLDRQAITTDTRTPSIFRAGRGGTDATLPLHSRTVTQHEDTRTETDRVNHAVPTYRGGLIEGFGGPLETFAQDIQGPSSTTATRVTEHAVHNTFNQTSTTEEDGGPLGDSTTITDRQSSATAVVPRVGAGYQRVIRATHGNAVSEAVNSDASRTIIHVPQGAAYFLQGQNMTQTSRTEQSSSALWQSVEQDTSAHLTYTSSRYANPVEVHSRDGAVVETVRGQRPPEWLDRLETHGAPVTHPMVEEVHESHHFEASGPTPAACAVVAVAAAMCGNPGGACIGGAVAQGAAMAASSVAAVGAFQNLHRNPLSGALRAVGSRDGVRSIATSAATMGLTRGLGAALGTPGSAVEASTRARASALAAANPHLSSVPSSIGSSAGAAALRTPTFMQSLSASAAQQAQFHAVNAGARVVTGVAFGGRLDQVAREAAVSAAVDFTGAVAANQAAFVADTQSFGRVGQTALQAGAGAGVGALMGGRDGARAGATAAAAAYTLATAVSPDAATPDDLQTSSHVGRLGATFTAMMLRHDVGIATAAAANAMDGFMVSRLTALPRLVSQARDQAIAEGASEEEATEMVADPRVQALAREVVAVQQEIEEELTRAEPVRAAVRQVAGSSASAASAASSSSPSWADDPPLYDDISRAANVASPLEGFSLDGDCLGGGAAQSTRIQANLERLVTFHQQWEATVADNPRAAAIGRGMITGTMEGLQACGYWAAATAGAAAAGVAGGPLAPVTAPVGAAAGLLLAYAANQAIRPVVQAGATRVVEAAAAQGRTPEESARNAAAAGWALETGLEGGALLGAGRMAMGRVGPRPVPTRPVSSAARAPASTTAGSAVGRAVNRNAPTMEALAQQMHRPANQNVARVFDRQVARTGTDGHALVVRMSDGGSGGSRGLSGVGRSEGLGGSGGAAGSGTRIGAGAGPVAPRPVHAAAPPQASRPPLTQPASAAAPAQPQRHVRFEGESTGAPPQAPRPTVAQQTPPPIPQPVAVPAPQGLISDPLSQLLRQCGRDVEVRSGILMTDAQRGLLTQTLRERNFQRLSPSAKLEHSRQYQRVKDSLIAEWERQTGQVWPTQTRVIRGVEQTVRHDAHHIIPQEVGGPHQWWNIHPLEFGAQHQGGVHGAGAPLRQLLQGRGE